jgi:hypothetical protein
MTEPLRWVSAEFSAWWEKQIAELAADGWTRGEALRILDVGLRCPVCGTLRPTDPRTCPPCARAERNCKDMRAFEVPERKAAKPRVLSLKTLRTWSLELEGEPQRRAQFCLGLREGLSITAAAAAMTEPTSPGEAPLWFALLRFAGERSFIFGKAIRVMRIKTPRSPIYDQLLNRESEGRGR